MPCPLFTRLLTALLPLTLSGCTLAGPIDMGNGNTAPSRSVSWCGALRLPDHTPDGSELGGLSDLAWDPATQTLYLLSDRGWLYQGTPRFEQDRLINLDITAAHQLRDRQGSRLEMPHADSESMTLDDRGASPTLLIGFERDHRIQHFSLDGQARDMPWRPTALKGAHYNKGLEAITLTTAHGLVAGLEAPPEHAPAETTRLFNDHGQRWSYQLASAPASALTSMAPLRAAGDRDGQASDLLTLERAFDLPHPLVVSLRRTHLNADGSTSITTLASLSSAEGWRLDNFEGLTRIGAQRYLMVSDDNFSVLQSSLLSCIDVDTPD